MVTRLSEILATLDRSFSLRARIAVAALREQVARESHEATVHAFDRKILVDLQQKSVKTP